MERKGKEKMIRHICIYIIFQGLVIILPACCTVEYGHTWPSSMWLVLVWTGPSCIQLATDWSCHSLLLVRRLHSLSHGYSALQRGRVLPGTWGKWGQPEGRGWGRARPQDKERDKQSNPSKEGGNMEQEEEGKKSPAWQRGPSMHRVSIVKKPLSMYSNVNWVINNVRSCLFQENKSCGIETHLHSSSDVHHCTSQVTAGTGNVWLSCPNLAWDFWLHICMSTYSYGMDYHA